MVMAGVQVIDGILREGVSESKKKNRENEKNSPPILKGHHRIPEMFPGGFMLANLFIFVKARSQKVKRKKSCKR